MKIVEQNTKRSEDGLIVIKKDDVWREEVLCRTTKILFNKGIVAYSRNGGL